MLHTTKPTTCYWPRVIEADPGPCEHRGCECQGARFEVPSLTDLRLCAHCVQKLARRYSHRQKKTWERAHAH